MPAYIQHREIETPAILCPGCVGLLPMYVREVEPHWSMARIDFIYECAERPNARQFDNQRYRGCIL